MIQRAGQLAAVALLTVALAWPQIGHLSTHVLHFDPYFSMWRLAWIAHALHASPAQLFDANIFHPALNTLALSDATILQGVLGAPVLWAGASPVLVYNLLLLAGIAGSGAGMFVLARRLTGEVGPALVAAAVFTMGPYRLEHYMHLELQWAMWIPLTLWAVHRAVDEGSWRAGALAGAFLSLQTLSCVYYGVFLAMTLAFFVPALLLLSGGRRASGAVRPLILGGAIACVLIVPYAIPYLENSDALGPRALSEVSRYSARPISYLTATEHNWLWGWTSAWEGTERRLFPGFIAILLSVAAVWGGQRRLALLYGAVALLAMELSFGVKSMV